MILPQQLVQPAVQAPVWTDAHCGGAWLLTRYDDVAAALRDPRFSVRRAARWINSGVSAEGAPIVPTPEELRFKRLFSRSLLFLDGRAHRRLRDVLQPAFKPADLQRQAPAIAAIAEKLAADLAPSSKDCGGGQAIDFVAAFARPLPARVIALLLGLREPPPDAFTDWATRLAAFIGSPTPDGEITRSALHALGQMCDFFARCLAQPDAATENGLLAQLVHARQTGRLNAIETLAQCATLLFAGYETTRNLLGNGLLALLRHPSQWAALTASPQGWRLAIREMLRHDSPVQYTGRRLVADVDIGGRRLRRGDLAILHIGAANHDPARFSDPDRFDICRDEGNHLSFGQGPHVCLGAALTQLEAEIAFTALARSMPDITLAPTPPSWQLLPAYRALAHLPVIPRNTAHA